MQVGTPSEVYSAPQNTHVATFLGTTNLWEGEVLSADPGVLCCRIGEVDLRVNASGPEQGETVSVMVRPERVGRLRRARSRTTRPTCCAAGSDTLTFRGARTAVHLDIRGLLIEAEVANIGGEPPEWLEEGADVSVHVSPRALRVLGIEGAPVTDRVPVTTPDEAEQAGAEQPG